MKILDTFNDLDKKKQLAIVTGAYILIVGLFWFFVYQPKSIEVAAAEEKIEDLNYKILEKQKIVKNLAKFEGEVKVLNLKLDNVLKQLPDSKEVDAFLKSISVLASDTGLDVVRFSPSGEIPKEFFAELPVDIELQGTFHKLATFFYQVGRLPRIVNVDSIKIAILKETENDVIIKATCRATTYRYLERIEGKPGSDKSGDDLDSHRR